VRAIGLCAVQDGFDPLEALEGVEIRYHQYEQCHKAVSVPESIAELQRWQAQVISEGATTNTELKSLTLPKPGIHLLISKFIIPLNFSLEREYRRAVVAQQTAVRRTMKWQADTVQVDNSYPLLQPI
jgi:hypothetical protein